MKLFSSRRFLPQLVSLGLTSLFLAIATFGPHPHAKFWHVKFVNLPPVLSSATAQPRSINRRDVARQVHELLPDLPLENHYLHSETGEVDRGNSLVHRLIQYHYDVKSRPIVSRFDWKLTLADYLGANEWMNIDTYPDRRLAENPYENDVEAIRSLNRQQREDLVQALVTVIAGP